MNDKTLGAYKRTTPDPDETTGEALARLQAEMTRLLDEADAELRDEADGGVAAALIEKEAEQRACPDLDAHWRLAEASARPEGAEEIERLIETSPWHLAGSCSAEADWLAEEFAALWKETTREHVGRARTAHSYADAARVAHADVLTRAEKAEQERDEALRTLKEVLDSHDETLREIAEGKYAAESRPLSPEALTDEMCRRAADEFDRTRSWERALIAALTEPSQRPAWLDAPAVRAWHKNDGRTEHDGTPGKPRIWSPDYGTTETWSTPSLRNVPWTALVDVEPLDVSAELAEGLDRVAEFMRTGGVRVVGEEQS